MFRKLWVIVNDSRLTRPCSAPRVRRTGGNLQSNARGTAPRGSRPWRHRARNRAGAASAALNSECERAALGRVWVFSVAVSAAPQAAPLQFPPSFLLAPPTKTQRSPPPLPSSPNPRSSPSAHRAPRLPRAVTWERRGRLAARFVLQTLLLLPPVSHRTAASLAFSLPAGESRREDPGRFPMFCLRLEGWNA